MSSEIIISSCWHIYPLPTPTVTGCVSHPHHPSYICSGEPALLVVIITGQLPTLILEFDIMEPILESEICNVYLWYIFGDFPHPRQCLDSTVTSTIGATLPVKVHFITTLIAQVTVEQHIIIATWKYWLKFERPSSPWTSIFNWRMSLKISKDQL